MALNLTQGTPFVTIFRFTLPVIAGNLFQLFYTIVDSIIVGQVLGADALAAVGATSIIIGFIICFIQGYTGGFGICLGQMVGRRNTKGIWHSLAASVLLCVVFTVFATMASTLLLPQILDLLNTPAEIYDMAYEYIFIILAGTVAPVFYNMISNILRAFGDSRTPLVYLIFSSLLNIVLDLIFIGPLQMGVAGAAWATVLAQLLSAILCTLSGLRHIRLMRLSVDDFHLPPGTCRRHLHIALPMGFQLSVMCLGLIAMQGAVNALGPAAIAGYTAATRLDQVAVLVNTAFSMSLSSYVAQNYGAGLFGRIREGMYASLIQASIANVLMGVALVFGRHYIVPLFVNTPTAEICWYGETFLLMVAPFYLLEGALLVHRAAIQGMNKPKIPFMACMIELLGRVGATVILSRYIGYIGICLATPIAWFGACLLLIPMYHKITRHLYEPH